MSFVATAADLISTYGLAGIALSIGIENIGVPLPTEAAFLVANQFASSGYNSFAFLYWLIVGTQIMSSMVAYGLGVLINQGVIGKFAGQHKIHSVKQKIMVWYKKYGIATVFATRLIGYVRPWSSIVAGIAEFPFWPFVFWTTLGTLVYVYITMRVTGYLIIVWQRYEVLHPIIIVGGFVLFFGFFVAGFLRRDRSKTG